MNESLTISISQATDKGVKPLNQDFHDLTIPNEPHLTTKGIAIAIADGISSSKVSQEASQVAVTSFLTDYYATPETWSISKAAMRVISAINTWLYSQSRASEHRYDLNKGYVCTFSALVLRSSTAHLLHVGDTRVYRFRNGELTQLTTDHRMQVSQEKSYLARALGMDNHVNIDHESFAIEVGDIFMLATDGVFEFIDESLFAKSVETFKANFEAFAPFLVESALQNKSDDNLTAQLIRIESLPDKDVDELHKDLEAKAYPPLLEARQKFEGYTIERVLHSNSRSHVYLAKDDDTQEHVVIKCPSHDLRDEKGYLERFVMEEWIARRINSAHVVKAYPQARERNYLYTVSEFIEGQSLRAWMQDHPTPSLAVVRDISEQIAKGLQAFHRQEMIHQDIRPENIMIDANGTIKIIDLGATRVRGISEINTFSQTDDVLGTHQYAAPEYFLGDVGTAQSDQFSLALIIYEMLSGGELAYGAHVSRATSRSAQNRLRYESLYSRQHQVPIWVDETLRKALQMDPFKRYDELSEFIYDLRHPNKKYLHKETPPLIERDPVRFWKALTLVLFVVNIILLFK